MSNIKLKNANGVEVTYNGVTTIKIPKADGTGNAEFSEGGGSIGYTVTFTTEGSNYATASCLVGGNIEAPATPVISGKAFTGWYIGSSKISFPYTPSGDVTMTAGLVTAETCKVTGLGSSSPSSVTFSKSSGFNTATNFETVVKDGDTFIKFPTMWRKVETTAFSQITSWSIATAQIDSSYHVYPCFLKEDGVTILPYVLMGVSCSNSDSSCNSIAGYTGGVTQTISTGRTNARARGTGYQLMDWMIFKLWQDLLICKMETIDTNSGSGITTDVLGIYWGPNHPWIDGITHNGTNKTYIISYKPSKYINEATTSSDGYVATSYTYTGTYGEEIKKLGYDSGNEFVNYPTATTNNSYYNTYYCDDFVFGTSGTNPVLSSEGSAGAYNGAFDCDASLSWSNKIGVRLCYRPI